MAQLMITLDSTIVSVAPSIQLAVGLSDSGRQWAVTAYTVAFGGLMLLSGKLGDVVGRKRAMLVGVGRGVLGRQRVHHRGLPRRPGLRGHRRRHQPAARRQRPRLDRARLVRRGQRMQCARRQPGVPEGWALPHAHVLGRGGGRRPADGVSIYDSLERNGHSGWLVAGGTSASAPIIAGIVGLAGNGATIDPGYPYRHRGGLNDVIGGSNQVSMNCGGDYLCNAKIGYDGPTGWGTPSGIGAF
jgi:hypothetical protein